jgi:hypothetical protein
MMHLGPFLCLLLLSSLVTTVSSKAPFEWAGLRLLKEGNNKEKDSITSSSTATTLNQRSLHIPHQQRQRRRNLGEVKGSTGSYKKKKEKQSSAASARDKLEKGEKSRYTSSRKSTYKGSSTTTDRCGKGRKNTNIMTTFDVDSVDEVYLDSGHSGMRFQFGGDYNGTWIQTIVRINDSIRIGHDQLTFYDDSGTNVVGVIATQFDSELDYALVTAGTGAFECAQGSPTIHVSNTSSIVSLHWDLCVCATEY